MYTTVWVGGCKGAWEWVRGAGRVVGEGMWPLWVYKGDSMDERVQIGII